MNFDIDYIAHNNNLRESSPFIKVFIGLFLMILTLILSNNIFSLIIIVVMLIGICGFARVSIKDYLKFLSIPAIFLIVSCLFLLFFFGEGNIIYNTGFFGICIREDALNLTVLTFLRVLACFSSLGFIGLTTPIAEVIHVLSKFKCPKVFIEIAVLMYNVIFIFLERLETMRNAQTTRLGFNGSKNTYRSLGLLFTNLFFTSLDKSESLQKALDSRCYTGELPIYKPSGKFSSNKYSDFPKTSLNKLSGK